MSDEPPKDQQPVPSIWDTFGENRTTQPRDIAAETRQEFGDANIEETATPNLMAEGRRFYQTFFPFGDKRDRMFRNEDIGVVFHTEPEDGSFSSGSPMVVMVEIENGTESKGRIRRMSFKGNDYPEYFKDRGKIFRVIHRYDIGSSGDIKRVESITDEWTGKLSERGIKPDDVEEVDGLFFKEFDKLPDESKSIQHQFNAFEVTGETPELSPSDYELLKMIEDSIREGVLKENLDYEYGY